MEFKAEYRSYTTRYFGFIAFTLIAVFGFFVGSIFYKTSFFSLIKNTGLFILVIGSIQQIVGYFSTNNNTKILKLNSDHLIFQFFNGKSLTLKYSEIESLEYTQDIFKNFEFILKNGEKKMIYSKIKEPQRAFDLIRQKIEESKK